MGVICDLSDGAVVWGRSRDYSAKIVDGLNCLNYIFRGESLDSYLPNLGPRRRLLRRGPFFFLKLYFSGKKRANFLSILMTDKLLLIFNLYGK